MQLLHVGHPEFLFIILVLESQFFGHYVLLFFEFCLNSIRVYFQLFFLRKDIH